MLDEFARALIESARLPVTLSAEQARNLVSGSYLHWLAEDTFRVALNGDLAIGPDVLNRLSLVASLLQDAGDEHQPTAFLVGESADVARQYYYETVPDQAPIARFRRAIHYLDIASFFHLSDYDANANILAEKASDLLTSPGFVEEDVTTGAHLSYYRSLGHFLQGHFGSCREEAAREVVADSAEERAFAFLKEYLEHLVNGYLGEDFAAGEHPAKISSLRSVLQSEEHAFSALSAEVERLIQFTGAVDRKSLYRILAPVLERERGYVDMRISGNNNRGYPFAWPPTTTFCRRYLSGNAQHAVITVPTGAGKSFLAELAVVHALRHGWVLYLAPTNALCAQIRDELRENLSSMANIEVKAFLGKREYTAELPEFRLPQQVLVITPEKALLLLKREPERFGSCSLVVLDECHILGERRRGDIAEMVLAFAITQNPGARVIFMSALVKDGDKLARWLERNTGHVVAEMSSPWRPTRTARMTVLPDWETLSTFTRPRGARRCSVRVRAFGDVVTPWDNETPIEHWLTSIKLEWRSSENIHWRNDVSRKLAEQFAEEGISTLLFVLKNRHHAFTIAQKFGARLPTRSDSTEREQALYALARYELGAAPAIEDLINARGIAVHTSTMLDCEREASEIAFASERARVLAATPTLSQGLNLVARAVIICGTEFSEHGDPDMSREELRRVSLRQVLNAAGRAARANIACRGISVIVPDKPMNIRGDAPKDAILRAIPVLAMKDASLETYSSVRDHLDHVQRGSLDQAANTHELLLLSLLPSDEDALRLTIQSSLGVGDMEDPSIEEVIRRLEAIKAIAVESGYPEWVLRASSLAVTRFPIAGHLKQYIENLSSRPSFTPPEDTYSGLAAFLLRWLSTLPAADTWDILRLHIRAWRWYWGRDTDPNLIAFLEERGYPENASADLLEEVRPIWDNMQEAVSAWLAGRTFLEIGEVLTRRPCAEDRKSKRTHAGHYLPRSITWSDRFIEHLSRFAGLLLALHNEWIVSEPDSVPRWFSETLALNTFPLGLRFGVQDPVSLAWYRNAIQERRAANLLRTLFPVEIESVMSEQSAQRYLREAREHFFRDQSIDSIHPVVLALKRII